VDGGGGAQDVDGPEGRAPAGGLRVRLEDHGALSRGPRSSRSLWASLRRPSTERVQRPG
jgi:hypothetical protein